MRPPKRRLDGGRPALLRLRRSAEKGCCGWRTPPTATLLSECLQPGSRIRHASSQAAMHCTGKAHRNKRGHLWVALTLTCSMPWPDGVLPRPHWRLLCSIPCPADPPSSPTTMAHTAQTCPDPTHGIQCKAVWGGLAHREGGFERGEDRPAIENILGCRGWGVLGTTSMGCLAGTIRALTWAPIRTFDQEVVGEELELLVVDQ